MNEITYIDPEQQEYYVFLKAQLPLKFPETNFEFKEWEEKIELCWNDGPCIDRVIHYFNQVEFPWPDIFYTRSTPFKKPHAEFYYRDKEQVKDDFIEWLPAYQKHLPDITTLLEYSYIQEYYIEDARLRKLYIKTFQDRRIYFWKDFKSQYKLINNRRSFYIDELVEQAVERFWEKQEYYTPY